MPEYADMSALARLLALRGWVAAVDDRPDDVKADAERLLTMADHISQERVKKSLVFATSINFLALDTLMAATALHPDNPVYAQQLREALGKVQFPSEQDLHRHDLASPFNGKPLTYRASRDSVTLWVPGGPVPELTTITLPVRVK